jgi:hypothetical protein
MSWKDEIGPSCILRSPCQQAVMNCLERAPGQSYLKARQIADYVYAGAVLPDDPEMNVRIHIHKLRKRLKGTPLAILTRLGPNSGYRLIREREAKKAA